ncbi:hypothetical protein N431DRAFT_533883 [Stipitochalara longipes BDJ]|nr:hypothetical protein N431DRAFT_533883 [Stipitochalara longipes BDJ]
MDDPSHLYENEIPAPRRKEPWNKNNLIEEMPRQGSHPESNVMDQEQTFNPWLAVDVVGSPGLTGLIGALTLDCCESIPDLDLSEPCSEVTQAEWDFVERGQESSTVIDQDPPRENQPPKTDCGPISTSVSALSTGFLHQRQHYMLGPLSEVDPFPRVVLQKSLFKNPRTDHLISAYSLRAKEIECRARFKALDSMKRVDILKLVEDMRSLCWRQYELDQYDLAESWSRCVVTSTLKISDIHPTKVLYACLDVLDLLRVRGKFKEALGLHPMVHDQIMKLVRPDHDLAILSRLIFAEIQNGLHEYEHEVSVCREVLQLCLLRFGTKSRDTLHILVNLAIALGRTGQYKEAETLSHIQIQLDYEVSKYTGRDAVDNLNALVSMVTLARCFTYQGKYDDSASVLHTAETCFENVIGAKNSYTWHHSFEKAEMLRRMGRLLESEEILRAQLEHAPESAYEDVRLGLKFLADLLIETGRENEVIVLWEKMFSLDIEMFGIEHKISRADCKKLGFSYAELGRYDDALIHFRRTSEQLNLSRSRDPDSHDTHLKEIQDWILAVENMKEQARTTGSQPVVEGVPPPVDRYAPNSTTI